MKIWPYFLILFVFFTVPGFCEDVEFKKNYLKWARKIEAGVESICEPIMLSDVPFCYKMSREFALNWRSKKRDGTFQEIIVPSILPTLPYMFKKYFDTRKIPAKTIRAVLNHRKAIRNNLTNIFDGDGKEYLGDGYRFKYYSPNVVLGYLEYFQILTLNLLLANNDFRFESEIEELLAYLQEPLGDSKFEEAKWHYQSQNSGRLMERIVLLYLRRCSEK